MIEVVERMVEPQTGGKPSCFYCNGRGWLTQMAHSAWCTPEKCSMSCPDQDQVMCGCTREIEELNEVYFAVQIVLDRHPDLREYYEEEGA